MNKLRSYLIVISLFYFLFNMNSFASKTLNVVATLPDYEFLAKEIGGDRILVKTIVMGNQDAHFIRPKPSFVNMVRKADVLISTGLDLELWLPTVVNKSGNTNIRSGQIGYVSTSQGVNLLEKPKTMSRSEGGVHIYGNPHMTCSPINIKVSARNIAIGLIKNDLEGKSIYQNNLNNLLNKIDIHLFGKELVKMLGGDILCDLAEKGTLITFLEKKQYQGKYLINYLGGWLKQMMPLRGKSIVTYHKNWIYFVKLFGLEEAGTVEPKPGISPSPKHVTNLVKMMKTREVGIILAANYFDEQKINTVADRVGAKAVIVPLYVKGESGIDDYFQLVDCWTGRLLEAARDKGMI